MTKIDKVKYVIQELDRLYPAPPIPLKHKDPYTLLIAVLLSAQCTDERVNKVTPELFALADNPFDMVQKEVVEIQNIINVSTTESINTLCIVSNYTNILEFI